MKILVTGSEGYIGSVLVPLLLRAGYQVLGVDTGFHSVSQLYSLGNRVSPPTLVKDIRHLTDEDLHGVEAVVHMAELSNDPAGQLSPQITYDINHNGSVHLAQIAKAAGVKRFIYTSSCSVYGVSTHAALTEADPVNPQTAYAHCKVLVENDLQQMADPGFSPTFLRNSSVFGAAPRIRFDIVLNTLAGLAWTTKQISLTSDGTPWRPLVHVLDVCQAILCVLKAPKEAIHNQIFNVGHNQNNYQVRDLAHIVAQTFAGCQVEFGNQSPDNRNYQVCFDKITQHLPGFVCQWDARRGAQQLHQMFAMANLTAEMFNSRGYIRLKQLEHLIATQQIDANFFWQSPNWLALTPMSNLIPHPTKALAEDQPGDRLALSGEVERSELRPESSALGAGW
jgi:nucleoside-diphosphate-sugar epimerase